MKLNKGELQYRKIMKENAEHVTGKKLNFIDVDKIDFNTLGYETGKTYYNGYWGNFDKCIEVKNGAVLVEGGDGKRRIHMTELNPIRDFVVID